MLLPRAVISLGITLRNALSPLAGKGTPWERTLRSSEGEIHISFPWLFAFRGSKEPGRCKFSMEQQLLEVISSGSNWHRAPAWACQSQNNRLILTNTYGMATMWQTLYWVINAWGYVHLLPSTNQSWQSSKPCFKNKTYLMKCTESPKWKISKFILLRGKAWVWKEFSNFHFTL